MGKGPNIIGRLLLHAVDRFPTCSSLSSDFGTSRSLGQQFERMCEGNAFVMTVERFEKRL